jgi:hypothetical protein
MRADEVLKGSFRGNNRVMNRKESDSDFSVHHPSKKSNLGYDSKGQDA